MSTRTLLLNGSATLLLIGAAVFAVTRRVENSIPSPAAAHPHATDLHSSQDPSLSHAPSRASETSFQERDGQTVRPLARPQSLPSPLPGIQESPDSGLPSGSFLSSNGRRRENHRVDNNASRSTRHGQPSSADARTATLSSQETNTPSADVVHFNGLRIEVHGYDSPENGGDLLISVTPADDSLASAINHRAAFTLEEELFRAKWGWTAFDQVKRVALESLEGTIR